MDNPFWVVRTINRSEMFSYRIYRMTKTAKANGFQIEDNNVALWRLHTGFIFLTWTLHPSFTLSMVKTESEELG